jgi:hypothetical protein
MMKLISSIFSSNGRTREGSLESVRSVGFPVALCLALIVVAAVEIALWGNRQWFADRASWHWQAKSSLLKESSFSGDVAIIGSSISYHSLNPLEVGETGSAPIRCVNIALNGLTPQLYADYFRRYLESHSCPKVLVVEVRSCEVEDSTWFSGPWWNFLATSQEMLRSRVFVKYPEKICDYYTHRVLASYSYGRSLDAWLTDCVRTRGISKNFYSRNQLILDEVRRTRGFATGDTIGKSYTAAKYQDYTYPWRENPSGREAFGALMELVKTSGATVVLMRPPGPELVEIYRLRDRFDDGFSRFVEGLRSDNADTRIEVFRPMGFVDTDFSDDHHLSSVGGSKLSQRLSEFLGSLSDAQSPERTGFKKDF